MTLHQKTLLTIGLSFVGLSSCVQGISQITLLQHFREQDESNLARYPLSNQTQLLIRS
jgi:hypothetical protein